MTKPAKNKIRTFSRTLLQSFASSRLRRQGFTLIELLIYTGIFAGLMVAFIAIFVAVTSIQARQSSVVEVNQQSQFLLQQIQYYTERSSVIELPENTATTTLKLRMASSTEDPTYLTLSNGIVYLQQTDSGALNALTSNKVTVSGLTFTKRANAPSHDSVSVSFTVAYNTTSLKQQFSQSLQFAVSRVSAATFDSNVIPSSTATYDLGVTANSWRSINSTIYFSSGNVGIGSGATSPGSILDIDGALTFRGIATSSRPSTSTTNQARVYFDTASGTLKLSQTGAAYADIAGASSQWVTSGNNIYYNTGNVGIGTTVPSSTLHVVGSLQVSSSVLYASSTTGFIGIGTITPSGPLHVKTNPSSVSATGGTITTSGSYTIHTFTSSGTFTPSATGTVEYLVVAGGGGGSGGGGGAGGMLTGTGFSVSPQAYTITVGAGGTAVDNRTAGTNGGNSVFSSVTATGGGGGGAGGGNPGLNGGSGGGKGWASSYSGPGGTGISGQGYAGGTNGADNTATGLYTNGGGGGASAVGANANNPGGVSGNGGAGTASSISGSSVTYAGGGGGGGATSVTAGSGGSGGGGGGSTSAAVAGTAGTANRGGGGGGGFGTDNTPPNGVAGAGGSGIVIIRYLTAPVAIDTFVVNPSTGNVGIGTTNPTYQLQLSSDSAAKPSTSAWTVSSDARIKKDINNFTDGLGTILKVRPVTYKYNGLGGLGYNDTATHIGIIAQELEPVAPYMVETGNGVIGGVPVSDFKSYQGHALPFILVNAVKELAQRTQKIMDDLKSWGIQVKDGVAYLGRLAVDFLEVRTARVEYITAPHGVTTNDAITGKTYCMRVANGEVQALPGECP